MATPILLAINDIEFPNPELALSDPNGLLAFGGDLSPERLINAYQHGIFPWFNPGNPICWWSPDPRAVLFFDDLKISQSLAKTIRQNRFTITTDQAFDQVISACAATRKNAPGTWITDEMIIAYNNLHALGHAHSIEAWQDDKLVGGLYGVSVGSVFCGESMFSRLRDASKVVIVHLVRHLQALHYQLLDCQIQNPHLASLGVTEIPRTTYLKLLKQGLGKDYWRGI